MTTRLNRFFVGAASAIALAFSGAASAQDKGPLYKVSADGKKVDAATHEGARVWTNSACVACHGRHATGGAGGGPNILTYLQANPKEAFVTVVMEGRVGTAMVPWKTNDIIVKNLDSIYAYLKGRSEGKIAQGGLEKLE